LAVLIFQHGAVMPFYVEFLTAIIDALTALVAAAMTIAASLMHPAPQPHVSSTSSPAIALVSYVAEQDVSDLVTRLRDANPQTRAGAACELQRMGTASRAAVAALVERLSDASPVDPNVCGKDRHYWSKDIEQQTSPGEEAAAALVAIGTESLPSLVAAAGAPQWVARRNAVWALGALDDARGVKPVLAALEDREPPVRRVAAWALGALDSDVAVSALIAALNDSDATVRSQVAWALGAIGDRRAVDGLIKALKDQDDTVRRQAAWALGAIGDRRAADALAATLKDSSPGVRRQAAWALGAIGR
jgi:HEAT repeat protein